MGNRREYTIEFKLEAMKLVRETGQPSAKIARDLGMSGDLLSRWVRKYNEKMSGVDAFPGKGKLAPYDKERFDLKKELARITRERDILKKALSQPKRVFIKEHRSSYKIQEVFKCICLWLL